MSFLSSHWPKSEQGYELIDGIVSSTNSRCSSPVESETTSSRNSILEGSLSTQAICSARRILRKKSTLFILALIITITIMQPFLNVIFQPPAYVIVEPADYTSTLDSALQDSLAFENTSIKERLQKNVHKSSSDEIIPNTIFSSDKHAPSTEWADMWKSKGFHPSFFDDAQADAWVESNYKGTKVYATWKKLPRTILRADMLRYLLLLLEGGTWSDMDTVPVRHFANWTAHTNADAPGVSESSSPLPPKSSTPSAASKDNPIRAIIGIECVPEWKSLRGALEMINIKPINRHRGLQFVQWTIHFAPHHPIMLDVIRRILQTTDLYDAYRIEQDREKNRMGWQWHWHQKKDDAVDAKRLGKHATITAPWESISQQWIWTQGHWRLGWHSTSVEEWTGPAVFTDAVVSYIFATTGIRPEQMARIDKPTQFGDLLILPEYGFAPPRTSSKNPYEMSRVVHLYRGSWKKNIASRS